LDDGKIRAKLSGKGWEREDGEGGGVKYEFNTSPNTF
jgi:hypothetical protein